LEEELHAILHRFPRIDSLPGVQVLRKNDVRTVCHVPAESRSARSPGFHVKVYSYPSHWDRFRYRFLRPRAEREWYALNRFRELGIPTAVPLAITELRKRGAVTGGGLVSRYLADTSPLSDRFAAPVASGGPERGGVPVGPMPEAAVDLLVRTGKLVRRMHDLGVWHRDLHAGNILAGNVGTSLYIVDLHSCLFLRRLARWQRRRGVVELLFSLRASLPPESHRVLLDAYESEGLSSRRALALTDLDLKRSFDALQRKLLASRAKKCFSPSSRFVVSRTRGWRLYHLRNWSADELRDLWNVDPTGRVLSRDPAGWTCVARVGETQCRVEYRRYTALEGLCGRITSHPLRRSYAARHALWVRKKSPHAVIALRERIALGRVLEAHLVTEFSEA
jgi:hypothetical protein